jgi:DNA-binding NtrC family response regulator
VSYLTVAGAVPGQTEGSGPSGLIEKDMNENPRTRRVLLIDDRPGIRLVFRDFLDVLGYASDAAVDGEDGLAMLAAAPDVYDLVVSDMKMPGMNGVEVAAAARRLSPGVEVLIVSGSAVPEEVERIEALGLTFLQKPVTLRAFTSAVERALGREEAVAELAAPR